MDDSCDSAVDNNIFFKMSWFNINYAVNLDVILNHILNESLINTESFWTIDDDTLVIFEENDKYNHNIQEGKSLSSLLM